LPGLSGEHCLVAALQNPLVGMSLHGAADVFHVGQNLWPLPEGEGRCRQAHHLLVGGVGIAVHELCGVVSEEVSRLVAVGQGCELCL
jgi:hypothetical protein